MALLFGKNKTKPVFHTTHKNHWWFRDLNVKKNNEIYLKKYRRKSFWHWDQKGLNKTKKKAQLMKEIIVKADNVKIFKLKVP